MVSLILAAGHLPTDGCANAKKVERRDSNIDNIKIAMKKQVCGFQNRE